MRRSQWLQPEQTRVLLPDTFDLHRARAHILDAIICTTKNAGEILNCGLSCAASGGCGDVNGGGCGAVTASDARGESGPRVPGLHQKTLNMAGERASERSA